MATGPERRTGTESLLELRIPRDRNGEFYPKVLALLRSQQAEMDKLVSALYAQGLSQSQVGGSLNVCTVVTTAPPKSRG